MWTSLPSLKRATAGLLGGIGQGVLADALHSFYVKASKGGEQFAGEFGILKGSLHARAHGASGTATDAVEDHHRGAFLSEGGINGSGI